MKKIGFVIISFGEGAQGGEVVHGRMLAERLTPYYNVEILTSTDNHPCHEFPEGEYEENGIVIRRFKNMPFDPECHRTHIRKTKAMRRIRHSLSRIGLLRPISSIFPQWHAGEKADIAYFESQYSFKPGLMRYIAEHGNEYDALLFINMYDNSAALGSLLIPHKSILIPLAHPTRTLYMPLYSTLFTRVRHIAFNTAAEQRMCGRIFGPHMSPGSVIGASIEQDAPEEWETVKKKYGLPDEYVLYLGRITKHKINNLIPQFITYVRRHNPQAKLVLAGGISSRSQYPEDPAVIFIGYVTGEEKSAIIKHATIMVNPSVNESLSLLLLEAMANGVPSLVNGKSDVMRDHCLLSGAALYYNGDKDFGRKLHIMLTDKPLRRKLGDKGPAYVRNHYDWDAIIGKLRNLIEII